jgi:hypothetical protein
MIKFFLQPYEYSMRKEKEQEELWLQKEVIEF